MKKFPLTEFASQSEPTSTPPRPARFERSIPQRLDQMPWCRFHWLFIIGLGCTWLLDGLEVTLIGAIAAVLVRRDVMGFTASQVGMLSSFYLTGAVLGSLAFGYLADRFGRRRFFLISLGTYLLGVGLTAFSFDFASFATFRFITGFGIGGEYAAVNSAIDELIPARIRGQVDLIINGTFWLGAALGGIFSMFILNPAVLPLTLGWRLGFAIGPALGIIILFLRRYIPESPRWLLRHNQPEEADAVVRMIEANAYSHAPILTTGPATAYVEDRSSVSSDFLGTLHSIFKRHRARAILGFSLMVAQAFLYNAIFFTYALVLHIYYQVPASTAGSYLLLFAIANFVGPLVLGGLFDKIGRRPMITCSYAVSGLILLFGGWLFMRRLIGTDTQIGLWIGLFFVASAAASAAYLTVSELFPLESRALAIAIFYSIGTAVGGVVAPWFFGYLIDSGSRSSLFFGYCIGAALMISAAIVELILGVPAERRSLEELTMV
jgi:MFS family permease